MIKSLSVHPGVFSFGLAWKEPEFYPDDYQFIAGCRLFCAREDYRSHDQSIPGSATTLRVIHLHPGSVCRVDLKAIYNPASIDAGLTQTFQTAFLSKYCMYQKLLLSNLWYYFDLSRIFLFIYKACMHAPAPFL